MRGKPTVRVALRRYASTASLLAILRAAESKMCPEPQAMSATRRSSSAASGSSASRLCGNQMVERMAYQRLDEVIWGIVGAGGGTRVAPTESES